jgi:hypothetical protein
MPRGSAQAATIGPERRARVLELLRAGESAAEAARQAEVSARFARLTARANGIDIARRRYVPPPPPPPPPPADAAAAGRSARAARGAAAARRKREAAPKPPVPDAFEGLREYSPAETEWLKATAEYRDKYKRRFMTDCEYLYVAVRLGYRQGGFG